MRGGQVNPQIKLLMLEEAFVGGARRVGLRLDTVNARGLAALDKLEAVREGELRQDRVTWTGNGRVPSSSDLGRGVARRPGATASGLPEARRRSRTERLLRSVRLVARDRRLLMLNNSPYLVLKAAIHRATPSLVLGVVILFSVYAVGDDDQALLWAGYLPLGQLSAIPHRCGHHSRNGILSRKHVRWAWQNHDHPRIYFLTIVLPAFQPQALLETPEAIILHRHVSKGLRARGIDYGASATLISKIAANSWKGLVPGGG